MTRKRRKRILMKGTVATYMVKDGLKFAVETNPIKVIREYAEQKNVPEWWGEIRLSELAVAMEWALDNIPDHVLKDQETIEAELDAC